MFFETKPVPCHDIQTIEQLINLNKNYKRIFHDVVNNDTTLTTEFSKSRYKEKSDEPRSWTQKVTAREEDISIFRVPSDLLYDEFEEILSGRDIYALFKAINAHIDLSSRLFYDRKAPTHPSESELKLIQLWQKYPHSFNFFTQYKFPALEQKRQAKAKYYPKGPWSTEKLKCSTA